jgi:hypothetical protein
MIPEKIKDFFNSIENHEKISFDLFSKTVLKEYDDNFPGIIKIIENSNVFLEIKIFDIKYYEDIVLIIDHVVSKAFLFFNNQLIFEDEFPLSDAKKLYCFDGENIVLSFLSLKSYGNFNYVKSIKKILDNTDFKTREFCLRALLSQFTPNRNN